MPRASPTAEHVQRQIRKLANPAQAKLLQRFFKTGPGHYGEGDRFLGLKVPAIRQVARANRELPLTETRRLLRSEYHEDRLAALVILVIQFEKADESERRKIFDLYLANTRFINNWDLVDVSAPRIVGAYLADKDRAVLDHLARSTSLWERRIAVLATFWFIRDGDFADALRIARALLNDEHDLIHKAVGWMLREIGKRDMRAEEAFLHRHCRTMPRTMLRYAIERMPPSRRREYMDGTAADAGV